jgi:hypothetical protein
MDVLLGFIEGDYAAFCLSEGSSLTLNPPWFVTCKGAVSIDGGLDWCLLCKELLWANYAAPNNSIISGI